MKKAQTRVSILAAAQDEDEDAPKLRHTTAAGGSKFQSMQTRDLGRVDEDEDSEDDTKVGQTQVAIGKPKSETM